MGWGLKVGALRPLARGEPGGGAATLGCLDGRTVMVSDTLFSAAHILGISNAYSRAMGIVDHYINQSKPKEDDVL